MTHYNYKRIILEIAKKHPSLIVNIFNRDEIDNVPIDKSWKEFSWYDEVLDLIKNNQMRAASYVIINHYRYGDDRVTSSDAMSIVQEIKDSDVDPVLPGYAYFSSDSSGIIVMGFDKVIARGDNKHSAALAAWDWHKQRLNRSPYGMGTNLSVRVSRRY